MSLTRSDNRLEKHPKPVQENERKLVSGAYTDWASTSEVNSAVDIAFRKNKYFWVNGSLMHCGNDGTTYRKISGSNAEIITLTNEETIDITWNSTRQQAFGTFPKNITVILTIDSVHREVTVDKIYDALPPSFTKVTVKLPGLPGIIVIS